MQSTCLYQHPINLFLIHFAPQNKAIWRPWLEQYHARIARDTAAAPAVEENAPHRRARRMNEVNPAFVLRNFVAQQAIER